MTTHGTFSTPGLESMAWRVADAGVESLPHATVRALGAEAIAAGVTVPLVDAFVDASTPPVVRQRIFGRIAAALSHGSPIGDAQFVHAA